MNQLQSEFHASTGFSVLPVILSRAGLFTLFTWLLWGDFCFTLMETVLPTILPLQLRSLGASNTIIALILTTIPSTMNFVLNPIISTTSDRYRSRLGRRIPFLLFSTPFLVIFLTLIGFSKEIGTLIHSFLQEAHPWILSANALTIGVIGALVIGFQFFNLFVNTIYWYLFNDVVPAQMMGRFLGLFRVVGCLAGALYNFFIFRFAESHTTQIFCGTALLYGVAFLSMCRNVKEGPYPPPEPLNEKSRLDALKTMFRECFSCRIYRLVYFFCAAWILVNCINSFQIFLAMSIGLGLEQVGKINGSVGLLGVLIAFPAGMLVDRFHPIRVALTAQIGLCAVIPLGLVYLVRDFPPGVVFWIYSGIAVLNLPLTAIFNAASFPLLMRLLPRESFGQFCAANAMLGALAMIFGGLLAGAFLDLVKRSCHGNDYYLRFLPAWSSVLIVLATVITWLLFREWKKLGGDENYRAPGMDRQTV